MKTKKSRGDQGVAIAEFALILPMMLILIFTIVDFGLFFFIQHTVQFATREGVRVALVGRILTDGDGDPMTREESILQTIRDKVQVAVDPAQVAISIFPVNDDYSDPEDWEDMQNAGSPGSYMRVRTRYSYKFVTPILSALVPDGRLLIRAQATYRNEFF